MHELGRWSFLAFSLFPVPLSVGCGDDDDDDAAIPMEELPAEIAAVYCGEILPCLGPLEGLFLNGADCEETFGAQFEDQQVPQWEAAIEAGTLVYHADKARACLDAFAATGCDIPSTRTPAECEEALEGTVALGEDCNAGLECAGVAYCHFVNQCPGTCEALEPAGATCVADDNCEDGLSCQGGNCQAPGAEGDACGVGDDPDCTLGLICLGVDAEAQTSGTCQPIADVLTGADGDACDPIGGGPLCQEGLSCILDSVSPTFEPVFLCAPPVGSGAACKAGFPDPCPDDQMCDADPQGGQIEGTCVSLPDAGEPCVGALLGVGCAPGLSCVEGVCTQIARIGEACTDDEGCYSDTCDGDTCAAPPACEYDGP